MSSFTTVLKDPLYIITLIIVTITTILGITVFIYKLLTKKAGYISSPCTIHLLLVSTLYSIIHLLNFNMNRKEGDPVPAFHQTTCKIQGFLLTWLSSTRETWSLTILFSCYQLLIHKRNITNNLLQFHIITIPICYLLPSIFSFYFLITHHYEINFLTCWIQTTNHLNTYIFYLIKWILTLLLIVFIIHIVFILFNTTSKDIRSLNIKFQIDSIQNQIIYPILQFIDSAISTAYTIMLIIFRHNHNAKIIKIYSIITMYASLIFNIIYLVIYLTSFKKQNVYIKEKEISAYMSQLTEDDLNAESIVKIIKSKENKTTSKIILSESYCD